ncbi:MAG: hypothetical protein BroJett021_29110 [Chloroflexota bacterium]|nr:carboxypeptidase regulatory-like domain-containing protein [Caldilinea sp.]GIK73923.1 MAG: hypothetical protein BroJett021_29110 [Chloroflexota bacterium]
MKQRRFIVIIAIIQLMLVIMSAMPVAAADNGVISGSVYNDVNGNGQPEIGEPNVAGATVYLQRQSDAAPTVVVTDAAGYFVATNLPYGVYKIWAEDASLNLSTVQTIAIDEVNGASSVELPIVYNASGDADVPVLTTNIFLPFVNR